MKLLITGSAGFIGSHLVDAALKSGYSVVGVDDYSAGKKENLSHAFQNTHFTEKRKSVLELEEKDLRGIDAIFHLAASKKTVSLANPTRDLQVNAAGTLHMLELAKTANVQRFIHASTGSVYGEQSSELTEVSRTLPVSFYGVSKLAGENYVMLYNSLGLKTTALRFFHVYGPRQESADEKGGVIAIFCRRLLEQLPPIIYGDGTQKRSFTYVGDIVRACLTVLDNNQSVGQIYNVASGLQISINEMVALLLEFSNYPISLIYKDWVYGDIKKFNVSNEKIKELGFQFLTGFEAGLYETWKWYRSQSTKGE